MIQIPESKYEVMKTILDLVRSMSECRKQIVAAVQSGTSEQLVFWTAEWRKFDTALWDANEAMRKKEAEFK